MGKKWWYTRAIQAPLLLITLCLTLHVFAKSAASASSKKGKASPAARTPSAPSPKTAKPHHALQLTDEVAARKAKGLATAKTAHKSAAKASPKKDKRNVAAIVSPKSSKRTKFYAAAKSLALSSRRHGQRKAVASISKKVVPHISLEPTERLLREDDDQVAVPGSSFLFSPETAPFPAQLNDERLAYRINSAFVLPAEKFILAVGEAEEKNAYLLQAAFDVTQIGPNTWSWQAPRKAGVYPVKIFHPDWGATIVLNVFVMVPFSQLAGGYVNGYRIGNYPRTPFKQLPTYHPPRGFIEVTQENENVLISPHFRLRQFLCKQESEYPKYIVLDSRLLLVLETVLKKANETGYRCPTLEVMSGYRTPYYNRAIGNSTTYSRHVWGDAADIFIDANPRDGEMDDLNRDGVVDFRDTAVLYNIVNKMYEPRIQRFLTSGFMNEPRVQQLLADGFMNESRIQRFLTGGLARYRETRAHGPFVHVDVRGIYTRWGQ